MRIFILSLFAVILISAAAGYALDEMAARDAAGDDGGLLSLFQSG